MIMQLLAVVVNLKCLRGRVGACIFLVSAAWTISWLFLGPRFAASMSSLSFKGANNLLYSTVAPLDLQFGAKKTSFGMACIVADLNKN